MFQNNPIKSYRILILFLVVVGFSSVFWTKAATPNPGGRNNEDREIRLEEKKTEIMEKKEQRQEGIDLRQQDRIETFCKLRLQRLRNRINVMERTHRFHIHRYERVSARAEALLARFNDLGVDTTQLTADLATLNTLIQTLQTKYDALLTELRALGEVPCDEAQTNREFNAQFRTEKEGAAATMDEVRSAAQDVKEFILNTIKPDLQEIRAQLPDSEEESEETTESST